MSQAVVIFLIVFTAFLKLKRDKHLHGMFLTDRPTEKTRLVRVDHLQSWSQILWSDETEIVRSM